MRIEVVFRVCTIGANWLNKHTRAFNATREIIRLCRDRFWRVNNAFKKNRVCPTTEREGGGVRSKKGILALLSRNFCRTLRIIRPYLINPAQRIKNSCVTHDTGSLFDIWMFRSLDAALIIFIAFSIAIIATNSCGLLWNPKRGNRSRKLVYFLA